MKCDRCKEDKEPFVKITRDVSSTWVYPDIGLVPPKISCLDCLTEDEQERVVEHRLVSTGLVNPRIHDDSIYASNVGRPMPVVVRGKPVSETIIEDRR